MRRADKRRQRETWAKQCARHRMLPVLYSCFKDPKGITLEPHQDGARFCYMPIDRTGPLQWTCGTVTERGRWVGGSQRLVDAVSTLFR